ncbi:MAG: ABC transporter ATP-binding protein [Armatimonadota bacterium]|nr:ABC transporter ATP-binding protein [Armatimonadota bacterium]MDR7520674.1 ABC transporter ATP-binding protein [Armatimonadota bacterium]
MMAAGAHVRLVEVTKRLGATLAVDHVSLDVPEGQFTTLLGPSGCGKTTTLRLVAGFYAPDAGDIFVRDVRVTDIPAHRRNMAMVFQEYALFPHMTVEENIGYGLRMRGIPRPEAWRRIAAVMDLVGLAGQEGKFPSQLSGGQQQRVALARALVVEPEVLLLDEPLSNLDAKLRVRVRTEIRALQQRLGKTTIYVTHDQEEALSISDRIAVMNHGRIVQVGAPREIYYRPADRFVADFVGLANFVRTAVEAPGRVRLGDLTLPVAAATKPGPATLVVRPETVTLAAAPPAEGGRPHLRGTVLGSAFLGGVARYWVGAMGMEWVVDQAAPGETAFSGEVYLALAPDRMHVLYDHEGREEREDGS